VTGNGPAIHSSASPPGRLGRRLLADIEVDLAYFAIAHAG
jgi:hypothetical protein